MKKLAFIFLLMAADAASAAQLTGEQRQALRNACAADIRTVCAGVRPGGGRIQQCVREKSDQLSEGCRAAMRDAATASKQ